MKTAIIALTKGGSRIGIKLAVQCPGRTDLFLHRGILSEPVYEKNVLGSGRVVGFNSLPGLIREIFPCYSAFIFVMAAGIVVRVIAPYLKHKSCDPGVVVVDEAGRFAVSLLSGHLGGGNELAAWAAGVLGGQAVITTATDVRGRPAVDMIAKYYRLGIEPFDMIKTVNSAIVNDRQVVFYCDAEFARVLARDGFSGPGIELRPLAELTAGFSCDRDLERVWVVVTDRVIPINRPVLWLRPKNIIIGLGCRRGVEAEQVYRACMTGLEMAKVSPLSLKAIASIKAKEGEEGIHITARRFGAELRFFNRDELVEVLQTRPELQFSEFVYDKMGVGGVCEPAALLAGKQMEIVLPKQKFHGVTVAVARERFLWSG